MKPLTTYRRLMAGLALAMLAAQAAFSAVSPQEINTSPSTEGLSPSCLAAHSESGLLAMGCVSANRVALLDLATGTVTNSLSVTGAPLGLAVNRSGSRLYVACAAPRSMVCEIELPSGATRRQFLVGHTAMAPVLSPDESRLYVCNRFDNNVSVIDLIEGKTVTTIPVEREPVSAALTPGGKWLLVANHLHAGAANDAMAVARVSVIDTASARVIKQVETPPGTGLVRGIAVAPDGRFAAITHLRSLHWLSTKAVEMGRINCNAVTFLDLASMETLGTVLLDQTTRGSANPWAIAWSPDGKTVAVSCAGGHEVCLLTAPIDTNRANFFSLELSAYASPEAAKLTARPTHPVRVRARIPVPGEGPRALAFAGSRLFVANYFSDSIASADLAEAAPEFTALPLGPTAKPSLVRQGEMHFNDARLCAQGWQSCASCHDDDARIDALNWDLLNDGKGNPKNTRSLLFAHHDGPVMSLGVRENAGQAVRAGIRHILFANPPEHVATAMDAFLRSLKPLQSPHATKSAADSVERGRRVFQDKRTGCARCHPGPLFTDLKAHDVGTSGKYRGMWDGNGDDQTNRFVSPTLCELWRTGPYLHDGSAATLSDVFDKRNAEDKHGTTSHLTPEEFKDLMAYLLSL